MTASHSDALVLFGVTGDLAHKMIFPALYALAKRDVLKLPIIGVASPNWSLAQLCNRVKDSLERSGKCLAETAHEVLVELKPPQQGLFADSSPATGRANYLRFRLSPGSAVALAARVKRPGKEFVGDQRELYLVEEQPGGELPYERLLGDAIAGDGALFTREDAVEAAWAVVEPVLKTHHRSRTYKRGSWGPKEADALIAANGRWHNPQPEEGPG